MSGFPDFESQEFLTGCLPETEFLKVGRKKQNAFIKFIIFVSANTIYQ